MLAQKPETLASFLNPRQTVQFKDLIMVGKKDTCERIEWPCGDSVVPWTPVGPIWGLLCRRVLFVGELVGSVVIQLCCSSVRWDMCFGKGGKHTQPEPSVPQQHLWLESDVGIVEIVGIFCPSWPVMFDRGKWPIGRHELCCLVGFSSANLQLDFEAILHKKDYFYALDELDTKEN